MAAVRIKDSHLEQRSFQTRMAWAALLILISVGALAARLSLLQIVRHDYYLELSQGNRARIEPIPANRGLILDRTGKVLAENQPAYQLELVREQVKDLDATLRALAALDLLDVAELPEIRRQVYSSTRLRGRADPPAHVRGRDRAVRRATVTVSPASTSARVSPASIPKASSACMRSAMSARSARRT